MKCICGSKARMIGFKIKDENIGFLLCCQSIDKCGLNSNWQLTKKDARREFKRAMLYGNIHKTQKRCRVCGRMKGMMDFYRSPNSRDGYFNTCKACHLSACKENNSKKGKRASV